MFLCLLDPDPLVRDTDPDPHKAKIERKPLISTVLQLFYDFEKK
jgi:hypothetical protein